jgi:hypothetical protein
MYWQNVCETLHSLAWKNVSQNLEFVDSTAVTWLAQENRGFKSPCLCHDISNETSEYKYRYKARIYSEDSEPLDKGVSWSTPRVQRPRMKLCSLGGVLLCPLTFADDVRGGKESTLH